MKQSTLLDILPEKPQKPSGRVTCLGMTFDNDEGILNLSDSPYNTACPNPWNGGGMV